MSHQCHAVLKDYANAWGMTMSEVMHEAIRSFIHKDSKCFEHISSLLAFRGIPIDKRTSTFLMHSLYVFGFPSANAGNEITRRSVVRSSLIVDDA